MKTTLTQSFPVLGTLFSLADYAPIDLSRQHPGCADGALLTQDGIERAVEERRQQAGARFLYGGYLEDRCIYLASPHFQQGATPRTIHLGVDLWAPPGTPLYAPLPSRVVGLAYNDNPLDYGSTIILEHPGGDEPYYSLYGHLSRVSLHRLDLGQLLEPGDPFATIGLPEENGGWYPHLHIQLITDLLDWEGDFPGATHAGELEYYRTICPNPLPLLGLDHLSNT